MEELRLRKITIRTAHANDLESFLVEVLGAEITPVTEDSFLAEVAGVTFDVRAGTPVADDFEFWVSASFLADVASRWEFYRFRRAATLTNDASHSHFTCQDIEGRSWSVYLQTPLRGEYPSIPVRNC